jgi:CheY-like chemotaxis protein
VDLPRIEAATSALRAAQLSETDAYKALSSAAAGTGGVVPRMLYVEDDEDLVSVIRAALTGRVHIVAAHSLADAERLLREESFGLVVLDQSLPDGNGITLIDKISESYGRSLPIIILSATDVPHDVYKMVAAVLIKSQESAAHLATTILSYFAEP